MNVTADLVRAIFLYDPLTGILSHREGPRAGLTSGTVDADGYIRVGIGPRGQRKLFKAHRLIWLWMTGEFPAAETDHINGDKVDNRWNNLREATASQNQSNKRMRSDNTSGYKGVRFSKGKWEAAISVNGRNKHLGRFLDPRDAHRAYCEAALAQYGEFARFQ